jgi:bacterioferritin
LPNLQRVEAFSVGETVTEQLQLAGQLESNGAEQFRSAIAQLERTRDHGTRLMLSEMLLGEEAQLSWIESQLGLIDRIGEANYVSQMIRE